MVKYFLLFNYKFPGPESDQGLFNQEVAIAHERNLIFQGIRFEERGLLLGEFLWLQEKRKKERKEEKNI